MSVTTDLDKNPREEREEVVNDLFPWMFNELVDGVLSERDDGNIMIFSNDEDVPSRQMTDEDIKITTKWADNSEMMHYSSPNSARETAKLGIKWDSIKFMSDEQFVFMLLHEVTHTIEFHHEWKFWLELADNFDRLLDNKDKIEDHYPDFNWKDFRGYFVNDPYDSVNDPDLRDKIIEKFEEVADYQFDWYMSVMSNPPRWGFEEGWDEDDDVQYMSVDELDTMDCNDGVIYGAIVADRSRGISDLVKIPEIEVSERGAFFFGQIWATFLERMGEDEIPVKVV